MPVIETEHDTQKIGAVVSMSEYMYAYIHMVMSGAVIITLYIDHVAP